MEASFNEQFPELNFNNLYMSLNSSAMNGMIYYNLENLEERTMKIFMYNTKSKKWMLTLTRNNI